MERVGFFLNKGIWIKYRDADKNKEVSIISGDQNVSRVYELVQKILRKP